MNDMTSAVLVAKIEHSVVLIRNEKDGLWTLPAVYPWDGSEHSVTQMGLSFFYPYFEEVKIKKLRLLASPSNDIVIDDIRMKCSVFDFCLKGKIKENMRSNMWLAHYDALVPQVITPDMRGIIGLPELQSCLS
jgi:hypothetical protein